MLIYERLQADHKEVKNIFDNLEILKNKLKLDENIREQIIELFNNLKDSLKIHSKIEDEKFYNKLENFEKTHDLILESREEHSLVDRILNELSNSVSNLNIDDKWFAKLHELKEMVEHHVESEENKLFKQARNILNDQEGEKIYNEFSKAKEIECRKPR